ncbi:MAG: class I SAM-dependent RNA methyltransferase [Treponema sp.]|jgi:putative N6-adenine-specific DNA methylase|nr:class I SAM-dependent RNA methyltransferase [Treponema sp.]
METLIALCGVGAEKVVANELRKLNLRIRDAGFGRVRFEADIQGAYRALMSLRAADRLLLEAACFPAPDFDTLFDGTSAVPWEGYIPAGMGLRVTKVRTNRSRLEAVTSIQGVIHKAAADRLCKAHAVPRLPDTGPQAELRAYIEKDEVSLLLDLSGEPLFKRGYRSEGGAAPLRETTAAALLFLTNWRRKFPLYDPFCGSGTIVIEAALYAWNMAPGLGRSFALSDLSLGNPEIERTVREELLARVDFSHTVRIYGSDMDPRAVSIAGSNLIRAFELARGETPRRGIRTGLPAEPRSLSGAVAAPAAPVSGPAYPALPNLRVLTLRNVKAPAPEGCIVTNPPYGVRLGEPAAAEATYREMAELEKRFPGWKLAVLTDHPGFESHFGRKAESCREITNGAIDSYLFQYGKL